MAILCNKYETQLKTPHKPATYDILSVIISNNLVPKHISHQKKKFAAIKGGNQIISNFFTKTSNREVVISKMNIGMS